MIRFLIDKELSVDGFNLSFFKKGDQVSLSQDVEKRQIAKGHAEKVETLQDLQAAKVIAKAKTPKVEAKVVKPEKTKPAEPEKKAIVKKGSGKKKSNPKKQDS